jgi:hypothetical protein
MVRTRTVSRTASRRNQQDDYPDSEEEGDVRNDEEVRNFEDNDGEGGDPGGDDDPDDQGESGGESHDSEDSDDEVEGDVPPNVGALTPGQAMTGILDYAGNKAHAYLFKNATRKLEEELFDCTPDQFFPFLKNLEVRANAFNWTTEQGIMWVRRNGGVLINLLEGYGSISLRRITRHEKTYWDTGNRASQDDRMLFECLMNSLSAAGKAKINVHSEEYMLRSGEGVVPSGLCLFKVIVRESYLDSNATTGMIREQLSNLDVFMPTVDNDITRFNNHVKMLLNALHARNERTLDLLTYLFKAYAVCNDKEFSKFIGDIQTDHDMGTKRVDANELMALAEKKFKIMKTLNKWEAPSHVEEKILALQAKLNKVQGQLKKAGKRFQESEGGGKKEVRNKKKPEWFKSPPASGNMHETKQWNGATWHYCCKETGGKCGGKWRTHLPKDCEGPGKRKAEKGNKFVRKKLKKEKIPNVHLKTATIDSGSDGSDEIMGGYYTD